jgi:hypothetical protein
MPFAGGVCVGIQRNGVERFLEPHHSDLLQHRETSSGCLAVSTLSPKICPTSIISSGVLAQASTNGREMFKVGLEFASPVGSPAKLEGAKVLQFC